MQKINFKSLLPHLIAVVSFIAITLVYFSPILDGKDLHQSDMHHVRGAVQELKTFHEKTGENSQWSGSMFSGMPSYNIGYTGKPVTVVDYFRLLMQLKFPATSAAIVITLLLCFYFFMLMLGVNPWLSMAGAIAYAFSTYNFVIIEAGHVTKAYALAYMAPMIGGVILTFRKKLLWGGLFYTIFTAMNIASTHLQITYYAFILIGIIVLIELIAHIMSKNIKQFIFASGVLLIGTVMALLPNTNMLYVNYEMGQISIRGKSELKSETENKSSSGLDKDYALAWSLGKAETITLLIPNSFGGSSHYTLGENSNLYEAFKKNGVPNPKKYLEYSPTYWGTMPFTSGPNYFGAIIIFLFVLGIFIVKGHEKWWILAATIIFIMLAWGKNLEWFTDLFFYNFPFYNKFRSVSTALIIPALTIPLLAILAIKNILNKEIDVKKFLKSLQYAVIITGGFCLIFVLMPGAFFNFLPDIGRLQEQQMPDWYIAALEADRISMLRSDAFRSLIFILLAGSMVWLFVKQKIKLPLFFASLILLVLVDMWFVNKRFLDDKDFISKTKIKNEYPLTKADAEILKDKSPSYRVLTLNNPFNDASVAYYHKSIGGYHAAKLRRYQELADSLTMQEINQIISTFRNKPTDSSVQATLSNLKALNMLNTKYIIYNADAAPLANPYHYGNAWFVKNYVMVNNANEEMAATKKYVPKNTAVIDNKFKALVNDFKIQEDSTAKIEMLEYKPNYLKFQYQSAKDQMVLFSEIFYDKAWNAYVNGKLTPHFRANYVLRGMIVPAGKHDIEFKCEPATFQTTIMLTKIGNYLIILLLLAAGFLYYRNLKKSKETTE